MTLSPSQLDAYLARIGVARPAVPDQAALIAIHRAHARAFTWEAVDAFMGWPSSIDPLAAFERMVGGRRGGWCYEMNGLLGAALAACGFRVTRLCAGVQRAERGEGAVGNHLTLRVDLDDPWLAEVGLGDALVEPVPLAVGSFRQQGFDFAIERADGDWLRFRNHPWAGAPSFDFRADHSDEAAMAAAHRYLMQDEASPFRSNLVLERHYPGRIEVIRNRERLTVRPVGVARRALTDLADFQAQLREVFDVELPDPAAVWSRVADSGGASLIAD